MRFATRLLCVVAVLFSFLMLPRSAQAVKKRYQVTGMVLELTDKMIAVENKDKERWEIERTADTKVDGDLKVGSKVTIFYTMTATTIQTKGDDKSGKSDKSENEK
jgi:hypothetical protein